jgi:3-phenylpropionate/trans-cinnamate dioxygenase ferredoxin component
VTPPATVSADDADVPDWYRLGPADELAENESTVIALRPPVAVFHIEDGFYATDDTCTHAESSLAEGYVEDGTVECEFHFAKFDIRTGRALSPPAKTALATYPVVVRDGFIYVDLRNRQSCAARRLGND